MCSRMGCEGLTGVKIDQVPAVPTQAAVGGRSLTPFHCSYVQLKPANFHSNCHSFLTFYYAGFHRRLGIHQQHMPCM